MCRRRVGRATLLLPLAVLLGHAPAAYAEGIMTLNCQGAADQYLVVSPAPVAQCNASDVCVASESDTHTIVVPDASPTARGVVTTGAQAFGGVKVFSGGLSTNRATLGVTVEDPSEQTIQGGNPVIDATTASYVRLFPSLDWTFTTTPTVTTGLGNGQRVTIAVDVASAYCVTLHDESLTPGTTLDLLGQTLQLCAGQAVTLRWDALHGLWLEETGSGGAGNVSTPLGASRTIAYFEERLTTTQGASYIATIGALPGGAIVERCLVRTNVAISGGYTLGVAGALTLYGTLAGTVGETNVTDPSWPGPHPNYAPQSVRVTSRNPGGFATSTGQVTVTCIWEAYGAPTQ